MKYQKIKKVSTLGSQLTAIISVTMVLIIVGMLAMSVQVSRKVTADIRSNVGFVIKLDPTTSESDINRIKGKVAAHPAIASFTYASPENILVEESELMGEDITALLSDNPFGAEFEVKVRPEHASTDSIQAICAALSLDPAVDEIVTETAVVDTINKALGKLTLILLCIAAALIIISFVLINNTVSLTVYSRRFIIHTMKLVGATDAFIRKPFILAGLSIGVVSGCVAILILALLRSYGASFDAIIASLLPWCSMSLIFGVVLIVGLIICALASMLATNRYLRADYDDMFK